MTPEAQNIAIAEACGWRTIDQHSDQGIVYWTASPPGEPDTPHYRRSIPDFLYDLNAMADAEATLDGEKNILPEDEG